MASYNIAERWVARMLARFPRAYTSCKWLYQRANYLVHRERKVRYELHEKAELLTPMKWAGIEDVQGEWFFGYYDRTPWSADTNQFLLHRVVDDSLEILALDRSAGCARTLAKIKCWNFQQGGQAHWLPNSSNPTAVFNDIEDNQLGCRLVAADESSNRFIPWPVQALHPNGKEAMSINYRRVHAAQPEYGYAPSVANFDADQDLDRDGIWRINLQDTTSDLVIQLSTLAQSGENEFPPETIHTVNHLAYSPSGTRFVFMHRWINRHGKASRWYVARHDGTDVQLLAEDRTVSHYQWRDDDHIIVWRHAPENGYRYYLTNVVTGERKPVGEGQLDAYGDGHPSYSPDRRWVLTDSYPDKARFRHLLLFDVQRGECIKVGRFFSPWRYDGERRCDLHPRWSPDGRWISIDSTHEGMRRNYIVNVEAITSTT